MVKLQGNIVLQQENQANLKISNRKLHTDTSPAYDCIERHLVPYEVIEVTLQEVTRV
jgi:hypothetical protein